MIKLIFLLLSLACAFNKCAFSQSYGHACFEKGDKVAILDSCKDYLECQGGFYTIRQCGFGENFDMIENACIWTGSFLNTCRECDFTYSERVKGSNSKYIYCENGVMKQGSCEGYFDRLRKQCMPENRLKYFLNDKLASCTPGQRKPLQNSCDGFMECDSTSKWVLGKCQDCQNFEPSSLTCVWSWKYYCVSPTDQPPTQTEEPTTVSTTPTETPSTSTSPTEGPSTPSTSPTEEPTTVSTTPTETPSTSTSPTEGPSTPSTSPTDESTTVSTTPTETPSTSTSPTEGPSTPSTSPTDEPTTVSPTPTEGPSTHSTKPTTVSSTNTPTTVTPTQVPECIKNGQKKVYKVGDCKDYLECDSGKWVKKSCSYGYDFDINNLDCTWSWWAKC